MMLPASRLIYAEGCDEWWAVSTAGAGNIGDGRILRVCDLCGGVDDHPRHVLAGGAPDIYPRPSAEIIDRVLANAPEDQRGRLLAELVDTASSDRHLDCCAQAGCPSGTCGIQTAGAEGKTGAAMLEHLTTNRPDLPEHAVYTDGDER